MSNMEHINPGDRVHVRIRLTESIATVERTTKTQIILRNGNRYRRRDGIEVGHDTWGGSYIEDLTEESVLRITYRYAVTKAGHALSTRSVDPIVTLTSQVYKDMLLNAKNIIDAALDNQEEA